MREEGNLCRIGNDVRFCFAKSCAYSGLTLLLQKEASWHIITLFYESSLPKWYGNNISVD